jgi:hypothetical protein
MLSAQALGGLSCGCSSVPGRNAEVSHSQLSGPGSDRQPIENSQSAIEIIGVEGGGGSKQI